MAIRSIFAKVTAETSGFQKGMRDAAKSVSPFQQAIGGLKDVGKTLTFLRGGAALAGISIASNRFADFTGKLAEWNAEVKKGQKSYEDLAQELRLSIPIFGKVTQGFINLDKFINPEKQGGGLLADQIASEQARNEERLKSIQERKEPAKQALEDARKELNRLNLGEREALKFDLRISGADEASIKRLDETWKQIDWFKARDALREAREEARKFAAEGIAALQDRGKQLADSVRTSAMQFKDATDELTQVLGAGGFGFTPDAITTFNTVAAKLRKDIFPARQGRTFGREIDLTREFIGEGTGPKKQNVEDAQLKVTNRLLQDILRQKGGTARVGP